MEGEAVYEGAVDKDGEAVSADVGETSPEELAPPDGVLESLLKKEVDAEGLLDEDADARTEADAETVGAPVALPDAESRFTVVDGTTEGVAKLLTLALPERDAMLLSD